jgi:hypothetical protein
MGKPSLGDERHGRSDVSSFVVAMAKGSLTRASCTLCSPRIETKHRNLGQGRKPPSGLSQDMGIHEASRGGERMQHHEGCHRGTLGGQREFPYKGEAVAGVKFDVFSASGQRNAAANFDCHGALSNLPTTIMPVPPCGEVCFVSQNAVRTPSHNMSHARSHL